MSLPRALFLLTVACRLLTSVCVVCVVCLHHRYTALYLHGGVYADVDVVAKAPMAELVNSLPADLNMSGVVFVESLPSPWLIGFM